MPCNKFIFYLLLILSLFFSDSKARPFEKDHLAFKKVTTLSPLIFIHGFKGSVLVDENGHVEWINALTALGIYRPKLALPLTWSQYEQEHDELVAKEPISEVRILPIIPSMMIYGKWLDAVNKYSDVNLLPFAYDWRRDNGETSLLFEKYIEKTLEESGKSKCSVVAHSMGGLITLSVMNRRPELFKKVVFAGVPFKGCISFLEDMTHGKPVGLNRSVLSPAVLFTFPSVYSLFPGNLRSDLTGSMVDQKKETVPINFFSAKEWHANQLGIYAEQNTYPFSESETIIFLKNALEAAKAFRLSMIPEKKNYPPVLVITSNSTPTIAKVKRVMRAGKPIWDFKALPTEPGDGRVTETSSLPPNPIQYETQHSTYDHATLLNDPVVIERIFSFLAM